MDIRNIFKEISEQQLSEFRKATEISHPGGKGGFREDAFKTFLEMYLPKRYAVGSGEVISPENRVSGQLDIVIYDPSHCPALITSTSHAVFPIESVYGVISMKSHLDSRELADAYENIATLKQILDRNSFQLNPIPGMSMGMSFPMPITGVIAYAANRSLEAIAEQAKMLDRKLGDMSLRPDFLAVIGQGIIAPRERLRSSFNGFKLPEEEERRTALRKTGRHTLLRLYIQILDELNALVLRPLELSRYDDMPRLIGQYRVGKHHTFVRTKIGSKDGKVSRLSEAAIDFIVRGATPVTYREHLLNRIGQLPQGSETLNLDAAVYEFNPTKRPPMDLSLIGRDAQGELTIDQEAFQPISIEIDGKIYAADLSSLSEEHFLDEDDFAIDELMSS